MNGARVVTGRGSFGIDGIGRANGLGLCGSGMVTGYVWDSAGGVGDVVDLGLSDGISFGFGMAGIAVLGWIGGGL